MSSFAEGDVLEGDIWPEPVRVISATSVGTRTRVRSVGLSSGKFYDNVLEPETIEMLSVMPAGRLVFDGDPDAFRLAVEAWRIKLAYEFDPHFAVSVSQIDPLPHQLEAVYYYMLPRPQVRFLLADDPGAGKTVMAGLLLKELKIRGLVERTLIVTPANLTDQWRRELKRLFGEVFQVVRSATIEDLYGRNVWEVTPQVITSIDFAKPVNPEKQPARAHVFEALKAAPGWDLVIVDEAHKMAAYVYGDEEKRSRRYELGQLLSDRADHFLLLTATPHKGDPENFRLLMRLLDWEMFESPKTMQLALENHEAPLFLRRMKEDMVAFPAEGEASAPRLFRDRFVKTITFRLEDSPPEWRLYQAVTDYVQEQSERAAAAGTKGGRLIGFTLALFQRRLASSVRAVRRSLERRLGTLERRRQAIDTTLEEPDLPAEVDFEELTEEERWAYEAKLEGVSLATTRAELDHECGQLRRLIDLAKDAERYGNDPKLAKLRELLETQGFLDGTTKLLLFTEHKDTLDYLVETLSRKWGLTVTQIHGGMRLGDEATPGTRIYAEKDFRESAQVMVATEAAGEGINLHYGCWVMVNYDIPWNPNRLEQRMGRIHRYGQTEDCLIYNLVADDTREGDVLFTLLAKIEEIRAAMGSDRVYDVISEILPGGRLDQLFRDALARRISWEEFKSRVQREVSVEAVETIRQATLEGLATRHIDLATLLAEERTARERRLMPEYVESFFLGAFERFGGTAARRDSTIRIDRVPLSVRKTTQDLVNRFGPVATEYKRLTFYKDVARAHTDVELTGPGHPLFESVLARVLAEFGSELHRGAVFVDPDSTEPALVTLYRARIQDGRGREVGARLFAVETDTTGQARIVNPGRLLDCRPAPKLAPPESLQGAFDPEHALSWAYDQIFDPYLQEIRQRRRHELELAERHVRLSLDHLIAQSNDKLMGLDARREKGEDVDLALRQQEARYTDLLERKDRRVRQLQLERNLTLASPEILGQAVILPPGAEEMAKTGGMRRDDETEAAAMRATLAYEEAAGRRPFDVHKENLGFDVRSHGAPGEVRYIEVKGRSDEGAVWLTPNEWAAARRFGPEFFLYVVSDAKTDPNVHEIPDPAARLPVIEELEIVRYVVPAEAWKAASV